MLIQRFCNSVFAFLLREMGTSYGRHPGGFLWAIIEPILAIFLLTFVFSLAFRAPALGDNFALFYATGYLPFTLYMDLTNKLGQAIRYSKNLLKYPNINFFDAIIARLILTTLVNLIVFFCVINSILTFYEINQHVLINQILHSLFLATILGLGVGTFNCYFSTRFPTWERIWSILNRPAFVISGVFFTLESVPDPYRTYLSYNPVIHVVEVMRMGFYPTYKNTLFDPLYVYAVASILFCIGLSLLVRNHRSLIHSL